MSAKTVEMPNRKATVAFLCDRHREAFPQDAMNDTARGIFLERIVVPTLNRTDARKWGLVTKADGTQPCDVMIWQDTREAVRCLTPMGPAWELLGAAPSDWTWTAANSERVPDEPVAEEGR